MSESQLLSQFLVPILTFLRGQDGERLREWLQVEPEASDSYHNLAVELRQRFSSSSADSNDRLERSIIACLPEDEENPDRVGSPWPGFIVFIREYLGFWRDANFDDLKGTHELLCGLVNSCGTAFAHPTHGGILLKTSMSLCEALSRLTRTLSKKPELQISSNERSVGEDGEVKTVVETAAEIIQKLFTTCLMDRTGPRFSRPEGKRIGVYMFANLVLRLLFVCKRKHLASHMLSNIAVNSPPLSYYPASQRVTYLYYLGRYLFAHEQYIWAARALQGAYLQTPERFVPHRMRILTYLIPANILLGRLPSAALFARREARPLALAFAPIADAVRTGDFVRFQNHIMSIEPWLWRKSLFLQLRSRLRPLLWRSLSRRVFLITHVTPDPDAKGPPTLNVAHLLTAATYLQHRLEGWVPASPSNPSFDRRMPPSNATPTLFQALSNNAAAAAMSNNGNSMSAFPFASSTLTPPPMGSRLLSIYDGIFFGNMELTENNVRERLLVLIEQGFLRGFVAYSRGVFAITGSKGKASPTEAGWPAPWQAINDRRYDDHVDWDAVPGWVLDEA